MDLNSSLKRTVDNKILLNKKHSSEIARKSVLKKGDD